MLTKDTQVYNFNDNHSYYFPTRNMSGHIKNVINKLRSVKYLSQQTTQQTTQPTTQPKQQTLGLRSDDATNTT